MSIFTLVEQDGLSGQGMRCQAVKRALVGLELAAGSGEWQPGDAACLQQASGESLTR
jgi:hypothetical protein